MAENKDNSRSAMAAASIMGQRSTESIIAGLERRYNTQRNIHTVGGTNDDRMAKKEAYVQEQRHQKELEYNKQIFDLTEKRLKAEKQGQADLVKSYEAQLKKTKMQGPGEIGFDTDAVSQNFSSTLEEIALNFSEQSRSEQKAQLKRLEELKKLIGDSNSSEKEFLVSQLDNINNLAQSEYNKRATMAARAVEKAAELSEQYMDISSLYSGFVDHNPVMMALWRIGGDFIRRWRIQKKAQREAISRDKVNAKQAEELNQRNVKMAEDEARRADEINASREEILDKERESIDAAKKVKKVETEPRAFVRDPETPTNFNPGGDTSGDAALDNDFFSDLFGGVDEDGDSTGFSLGENESGITIDDSEPLMVQQEPTEEQKSENKFLRDSESRQNQINSENHAEAVQFQEKMFEKLVDIEQAILSGNKTAEENGKALDKIDGGGGLLEMLGLGKIAGFFKGPILKALMLFGPLVGGLGAVLGKIGLGGLADKLTGKYGSMVDGMGGDSKSKGKPKSSKGGRFSRMAKGAGRFAKGAGSMVARGGGMLMRGAGALLGGTAGALAGAGAAGYGVGTLINDYVLSDAQKEAISNVVGSGVDNTLSFFGNDDAKRRLELNSQMEAMNNKRTLGMEADKPTVKSNESNILPFKREMSDSKLIIQTDKIESNTMVNNRSAIQVPSSRNAEDRLRMLETKVVELNEVKQSNSNKQVLPPVPRKTTQRVVKSSEGSTKIQNGVSARNNDSSIQRLTDRFVSYGVN